MLTADGLSTVSIQELLTNFNAIDFPALVAGDYMAVEPDESTTLTGDRYFNYLWLFKKTTAAGGSSEGSARQVAVFKLLSVQEIEGGDLVDLTYVQLVGEFEPGLAPTPELSVSTTLLNFGTSDTFRSFTITNSGDGELTWTIGNGETWLTVSPTSGSTTDQVDTINLTVSRTNLSANTYSDTIKVTSNGGPTKSPWQ